MVLALAIKLEIVSERVTQDFWRGFSERGVLLYFSQVYEAGRPPTLNYVQLVQDWDMWGLVAKAIKVGGHPAKRLRVPVSMMRQVGATACALKDAGYTAQEAQAAKYTTAEVAQAGYGFKELRDGGFSLGQMKKLGVIQLHEIREAGYTVTDCNMHGLSLEEVVKAGYTLKEVKNSTLRYPMRHARDAKNAGFTAKQLKDGGISFEEIKGAGYGLEQVRHAGFTLRQIRDEGGPKYGSYGHSLLSQIRQAGFTVKEAMGGGYTLKEVIDAGYTLEEVQRLEGCALDSAEDAKHAGFSVKQLKDAYSLQQLKDAGFDLMQITFAHAGYTIQQIKAAGYRAGDILDLRHWYPLEQVKTVYTDQEIEEAGYTTEGERVTGTEPLFSCFFRIFKWYFCIFKRAPTPVLTLVLMPAPMLTLMLQMYGTGALA